MQAMRQALMVWLVKLAHVNVSFVLKTFQGMEMNLSQRLSQMGNFIAAGAPHLANVATDVEDAAAILAASMPNTSVSTVANDVAQAGAVLTQVAGMVTAPATLDPNAEAQAAATAANVSAQATATAAAHESRLQAIESTMVDLLPAVVALLQKFGQ